MTHGRPPREPGARAPGSLRGAALALTLLLALALGAGWLLRGGGGAPLAPDAAAPDAAAVQGGPEDLPAAPDGSDARSGAAVDDELPAPEPVDLWVRVVERTAHGPRPGELRPVVRGVPGLNVGWGGARTAETDLDGLARFEELEPTVGELRIEPQGGLLGWRRTLDLARPAGGLRQAGTRLTYEVELRSDHGYFGGRLSDDAGAPVADAWVALVRGAGGARRSPADADLLAPPARSDAEGWFELPIVRGEERLELLVVAEGPGRPLGHVRTLNRQEASGARNLDVQLPPTLRAHVRVLEHDGSPARGRVMLQRDGATWPADLEPRLAHTPVAQAARGTPRAPGELDVELAAGAWVVHYLPDQPGQPRTLFQFALGPDSGPEFEFRLADHGPPAAPVRD